MNITVETNSTRFLETGFRKNLNGSVTTKVFRKPGKLPIFWNSQIPKRYKRNNIRGNLPRAFKIVSDAEVQTITLKYLEVGYPIGFIKSVISDFKNSKEEEQLIIHEWLFDQRKVLFKLPYCPSNERDVKCFIDKIESFTNGKFYGTRNIKSLFPLKDRVKHLSCVIYEGKCSCGRRYIGETLETVIFSGVNMRAQQVNQNLPNNLLITNHICLRGKFWHLHLYIFVKEKSLKRFSLQY